MRRLILIALLLAGCGDPIQEASCAELLRDQARQREMTAAVSEAADVEHEIARATWETYCSNSARPKRDRPFHESVRVLR